MEILNSGSFIPLDNREKIEQLIFTAQKLASEVSQNAGFQSSGQTNQQIGLELWKGAEYITRSHEEVTIRNIFLSKFLEKLRDIDREAVQRPYTPIPDPIPPAIDRTVPVSATTSAESQPHTAVETEDEFLGVVDSQESFDERPSYANECKPECEEEIVSMISPAEPYGIVEPPVEQNVEPTSITTLDPSITTEDSREHDSILSGVGVEDVFETTPSMNPNDESVESDTIIPEQAVRSVVLSEKEPYNFDTCTVTTVVQLLPESSGSRDCVVSVRSHDFAPQITFTKVRNDSVELDLSYPVSAALEQYRTSLPLLGADKMKKEQATTRKRSSKSASKSTSKTVEKADTEASSNSGAIPQEPAKDQQSLFAS